MKKRKAKVVKLAADVIELRDGKLVIEDWSVGGGTGVPRVRVSVPLDHGVVSCIGYELNRWIKNESEKLNHTIAAVRNP